MDSALLLARLEKGVVVVFTKLRGACFDHALDPLNCVVPLCGTDAHPDGYFLRIITLSACSIDVVRALIAADASKSPPAYTEVVILRPDSMLPKATAELVRAYIAPKFVSYDEILAYADGWPRALPRHIYRLCVSSQRAPTAMLTDDMLRCETMLRRAGMSRLDIPHLPKMFASDPIARLLGAIEGDVVAYDAVEALLFSAAEGMRLVVDDSPVTGTRTTAPVDAHAGGGSDAE